jgi:hypothetical protein
MQACLAREVKSTDKLIILSTELVYLQALKLILLTVWLVDSSIDQLIDTN